MSSASEKLKELDERIPPEPWMASDTKVRDMKAIRNALPQIVAAVHAAERYVTADAQHQRRISTEEIRAALTALEEALS